MFKHRFVRFLVSGGMGTLLSYGIYLALLQALDFRLSYTVSYVFGIIFAYVMGRFLCLRQPKGQHQSCCSHWCMPRSMCWACVWCGAVSTTSACLNG